MSAPELPLINVDPQGLRDQNEVELSDLYSLCSYILTAIDDGSFPGPQTPVAQNEASHPDPDRFPTLVAQNEASPSDLDRLQTPVSQNRTSLSDLNSVYSYILAAINDGSFPGLQTPVAQIEASPSDLDGLPTPVSQNRTSLPDLNSVYSYILAAINDGSFPGLQPLVAQIEAGPSSLSRLPAPVALALQQITEGNPNVDIPKAVVETVRDPIADLKTFQMSVDKGETEKYEWHNLVSENIRNEIPQHEVGRQAIIFELIKGEKAYVKDLEDIEIMYIQPLCSVNPPIIPPEQLGTFIQNVFCNIGDLHTHHKQLLDQFFEIQRNEHPIIRSVTTVMHNAILKLKEVYLEYAVRYPTAEYLISDEMEINQKLEAFVEKCQELPGTNRLGLKNAIYRPIPRLGRYELLLKSIHKKTPAGHEDFEAIPALVDLIKRVGGEIERMVVQGQDCAKDLKVHRDLVYSGFL